MENPNQENSPSPSEPEHFYSQEAVQYAQEPPVQHYNGNNSFATASLILGIVSLASMCCFPPLALILGGLGMVFSCLSKGRFARPGSAKAGMALSAGSFGIVLAFLLILITAFTATDTGRNFVRDYMNLILSGDDLTYEEIYDFLEKYTDGDYEDDFKNRFDGYEDYNDSDGSDSFGGDSQPFFYDWGDDPYGGYSQPGGSGEGNFI